MIRPGSNVIEDATCPDGTYPISGGWEGNNTGLTAANQSRAVDLSGDGVDDTWRVQIRNDATIDATTNSIAYCVPI